MMTLTEFLLARIGEDEAVAEKAGSFTPWEEAFQRDNYGHLTVQPTRVLAECAAKRAIVDAAWNDHLRIEGEWGMCRGQDELQALDDYPDAVTAMAEVYADHPDYRAEWRP